MTAVFLLLAQIGPACFADIDVWGTSSEGTGGEATTIPDDDSTGLSGSETGAPSTTLAGDSTSSSTGPVGSSGETTGRDSTSTTGDGCFVDEGMPCPTPPDETTGTTGDPCAPSVIATADGPRCLCADGSPTDPMGCGCFLDFEGTCSCPDFPGLPPVTCGWECQITAPGSCVCGNFPAPPEWCAHADCVPGLPCWCEDLVPPQPCPI